MKPSEQNPLRMNVASLAAEGASLSGAWPLMSLTRLAASGHADAPPAAGDEVGWSVRGEQRKRAGSSPEVWMHLQASTSLRLQCQRCLAPVEVPLHCDRWFRFVATENAAAALDAESEDDVLVLTRALDLRELVEDEFLLSLPVVPRHDRCPQPLVVPDGSPDAEPIEPAKENPFAVLRALKTPQAGH